MKNSSNQIMCSTINSAPDVNTKYIVEPPFANKIAPNLLLCLMGEYRKKRIFNNSSLDNLSKLPSNQEIFGGFKDQSFRGDLVMN